MAKRVQTDFVDDDFPEPGEPSLPPVPPPPPAAEAEDSAALKARIAELERIVEQQKSQLTDTPPGAKGEYWQVEVFNAPWPHVVQSRDAANAIDVYMKEMGVVSWEGPRPKVFPTDVTAFHRAQARRFGVKPEDYTHPGLPSPPNPGPKIAKAEGG
jgi:hypothetical protein